MAKLSKWIFNKVLGWKLKGDFPSLKKYIIIVVPHTSWHDFYLGVLVRSMVKTPMNYVAKKELFDSPLGWYFKWSGGAPIDRSKNSNTVDAILFTVVAPVKVYGCYCACPMNATSRSCSIICDRFLPR